MLTPEEKERIRQEEIYRQEIRLDLDKQQETINFKKWAGWWKFVNTSFGIWLLSSVIVGAITFLYSENQKKYTEESKKQAQIDRLSTEITSRLYELFYVSSEINEEFEYLVSDQFRQIDSVNYDEKAISEMDFNLTKSFNTIKKPDLNSEFIIFPEYSKRNLISLFIELRSIAPKSKIEGLNSCIKVFRYMASEEKSIINRIKPKDLIKYLPYHTNKLTKGELYNIKLLKRKSNQYLHYAMNGLDKLRGLSNRDIEYDFSIDFHIP
ncbi:hypothetical protein AHMF7605_22485 [Adhaeribacter arboris]|uniref:Uncharacterized protein n=1 Tax=Adhaeribacter arboris TaxID=2072846 RepID=A0A2T2YKQ5_9BACT|nr:hypothetical protein [Adhaeribacter arboris]PSR56069.1 hypothetical protein AHMF7605_22485 [Adhaeribacter arboris]